MENISIRVHFKDTHPKRIFLSENVSHDCTLDCNTTKSQPISATSELYVSLFERQPVCHTTAPKRLGRNRVRRDLRHALYVAVTTSIVRSVNTFTQNAKIRSLASAASLAPFCCLFFWCALSRRLVAQEELCNRHQCWSG